MPREITSLVYTFDELDERTQAKVLDNMRNTNVYYEWWDATVENFKAEMEAVGFYNIANVYFDTDRGSYFAFTARVDLDEWMRSQNLEEKYEALFNESDEYATSVEQLGRSSFSTVSIEGYSGSDEAENQVAEVQEALQEFVDDKAHEALKWLREEEIYLTSDECVRENILANEYEFTANGELV
jgi:hypothetical protein